MMQQIKYIPNLVSVAIPAYKATFLKEAIDSVLAQTYSNFELIIVNDKSPEDIDSIISSYKDSRIRYYKNDYNLGKKSIVHNWNKCLSYAQGEFFTLLCDDDIMEITFIEKMLGLTYKYPQVNVFRCKTQYFNSDNGNIIYETSIWPEHENHESFFNNVILGNRKHTISEFLYRTQHIKSLNGYVVLPAGYYSDIASIMTFSKIGGIASSPYPLIKFRKSQINISYNSYYNIEKVKSAIEYYNWLEFELKGYKIPYNIKEKREYDIYTYYITSRNIIDALRILLLVPSYIWNLRSKFIYLYNWLKNRMINS